MRADEFKSLRVSLGLTQERLAEMMGVHNRTIGKYEDEDPPRVAALAIQMLARSQSDDLHGDRFMQALDLLRDSGSGLVLLRQNEAKIVLDMIEWQQSELHRLRNGLMKSQQTI
jgi:DNA-binding XRE family transcriptional regulator